MASVLLRNTSVRSSRAQAIRPVSRQLSTLPNNPEVYLHPSLTDSARTLLTLLPTTPVQPVLALGSSSNPPSHTTFTSNPIFLSLLHSVLATHCTSDPTVQNSASAFLSSSTSLFHGHGRGTRQAPKPTGGWVHISDERAPPDWGRIADPEDIIGSVEVNEKGAIREGSYQACLTYRLWSSHGVMKLSPFLKEKLMERLKEEERRIKEGTSNLL